MKFSELKLSEPILRALEREGYETATPIQAQSIPHILEGKDVLGSAQTGTGKTAAFALPILNRLHANHDHAAPGKPRVLVLCPTRELASQIADGFKAYGANLKMRHYVVFGGVNQRPQADAIRRGVEILIATPGRLLDLANQRLVNLSDIHTLVLDEADRMLDMGFIHDIRRITEQLKKDRQTLLFSATMPNEIKDLAHSLLKHPIKVNVAPVSSTADNIEQFVYHVDKGSKPALLAHLFHELPMSMAIVFTRTKHGADKVVAKLHARGIKAEAIHGNKSQNARQRALQNFKTLRTPVLVATDIAARGIDVDNISHVVNYDLTHEPETYVHRIGRTARAGASGCAISFCDKDERSNLRGIERLLKKQIEVRIPPEEFALPPSRVEEKMDQKKHKKEHRSDRNDDRSHRRDRPHREDRAGHSDSPHRTFDQHEQPIRDDRPQREQRPFRGEHRRDETHPRPSHGEHKSFKKSARPHPKAERGFSGGYRQERSNENRPSHGGHTGTGGGKHHRGSQGKSSGGSHPFAGGGRPSGRHGGGSGKFRGGKVGGRGRR